MVGQDFWGGWSLTQRNPKWFVEESGVSRHAGREAGRLEQYEGWHKKEPPRWLRVSAAVGIRGSFGVPVGRVSWYAN